MGGLEGESPPLSQALGRTPSSKSPGLQRLLRALNPHGALLQPNCSWRGVPSCTCSNKKWGSCAGLLMNALGLSLP